MWVYIAIPEVFRRWVWGYKYVAPVILRIPPAEATVVGQAEPLVSSTVEIVFTAGIKPPE